MKLQRAFLLLGPLALAIIATMVQAADKVTVVDDQGRSVEVTFPVTRAVVINSYGSELLRALGVDDHVVGQDKTSVERLPYIDFNKDGIIAQGTGDVPNYEAIAALKPDVLITPRNTPWDGAAEALKPFGIPVVVLTAWDTTKVHFNADLAGQLFGVPEKATELKTFYDSIGELVATRTAGIAEKKSIYYESGESPFSSPVPGSGYHELIVQSGAENLFGDIVFGSEGHAEGSVHGTPIDPEELIRRNPDLVILEAPLAFAGTDPAVLQKLGTDLVGRPGWSEIKAVGDGNVVIANGYPINALSKKIGALYASTWLYPELYTDINPDDYLRRWIVEFQRASFDGTERYLYRVPAAN